MATFITSKTSQLGPLKLSLDDIGNIYQRLDRLLSEQGDREIANLVKPADRTDDEFSDLKKTARESAFKITTTIEGGDGSSLYGEDGQVFQSPIRPRRVKSIYMTNVTAYQGFSGRRPTNNFSLLIDFSKPPLLDFRNPVSAPTQNNTNLAVNGDSESWVAAIAEAVIGVTRERRTGVRWIHRSFVYDAGMMTLVMPFAFYICWKFSKAISEIGNYTGTVVANAAFVYLFFATLWFYRVLFGYIKWAFPVAELSDNHDNSVRHRAILGAIALGLVVNFAYDLRLVI